MDPLSFWVGVTSLGAELALLAAAIYRRVYRRLPVFTAYIAVVVVKDCLGYWMLFRYGFGSREYFNFYWGAQAMFVLLRGLVVAELLHDLLRPYRGVWSLTRIVLSLIAALLVAYAAAQSVAGLSHLGGFVLAAERGLEVAITGTLLALLVICRYFEIRLDRITGALALGLGLYSSLAIVNNTVLYQFFLIYLPGWSMVRQVSFGVAVLVWLLPLLRPGLAAPAPPAITGGGDYRELVPQVSGIMRELNDRLLDFFR
jgi:hypothetical protein